MALRHLGRALWWAILLAAIALLIGVMAGCGGAKAQEPRSAVKTSELILDQAGEEIARLRRIETDHSLSAAALEADPFGTIHFGGSSSSAARPDPADAERAIDAAAHRRMAAEARALRERLEGRTADLVQQAQAAEAHAAEQAAADRARDQLASDRRMARIGAGVLIALAPLLGCAIGYLLKGLLPGALVGGALAAAGIGLAVYAESLAWLAQAIPWVLTGLAVLASAAFAMASWAVHHALAGWISAHDAHALMDPGGSSSLDTASLANQHPWLRWLLTLLIRLRKPAEP